MKIRRFVAIMASSLAAEVIFTASLQRAFTVTCKRKRERKVGRRRGRRGGRQNERESETEREHE
jgi:hypothetical protein